MKLKDRIEELEKRVEELERRPVLVPYYPPNSPITPTYPYPYSPQPYGPYPYGPTCKTEEQECT